MSPNEWKKLRCGKKEKYKTKKMARKSAKYMRQRRGRYLSVYRCDVCGCWHLHSSDGNAWRVFDRLAT